ncbi:hypothetical protein [uncultured Polaribacter sp.]|uniref:THC0290_0291 family protein n=1 Tax=uncultured Polaribacter sp. TaxID=174711 RepID=UPI002634F579|nr:hypothetical protein [uncultured Polaribacter sp.]
MNAQYLTHDVGVFLGSTSLQTDYGERGHLPSELNNNNLSITVAHYLSFYNNTLRWDPNDILQNHLMVKTAIQYVTNTKLEHHGIFAEKQSPEGERLRAMRGGVNILNLSMNVEYFLKPLEEFVYQASDISFNPFVSFGLQYSFYNNSLESTLGDWRQDITVLPIKYRNEDFLFIGSGESLGVNIGIGTRLKIAEKIDLVAQYNYTYFLSDKIDGLQTDRVENRNNEWALDIQLGIVYHINFSGPLFY